MSDKKVVKYQSVVGPVEVGYAVWLVPVDHPDAENVVNGELARTSAVISYDETKEQFETANTLYIPA